MVSSRTLLLVGFIAATYAVSLTLYVQNYDAYNSANEIVHIYVAIEPPFSSGDNASYSPDVFTVAQGQTVILLVENADSVTHGLAIDNFTTTSGGKIDTGPIPLHTTVSLTFSASLKGKFAYYEPLADCAAQGGTCDSNMQLSGNMTVINQKLK